jgi:hypothetical protein
MAKKAHFFLKFAQEKDFFHFFAQLKFKPIY